MPTVAGQTTTWNVFHYTDLNALINIIHKDCIILRATNVLYQNDPHEIVEGVNIVNKIEKDQNIVAGAFRSYYITSFSANEDNLSMWGMYAANGNGCAIAFDYNMLTKSYEIMARCIYGEKAIETELGSFLKLVKTGCFVALGGPQPSKEDNNHNRNALYNNIILSTCLGAKNDAYKHEQETRGVVHCDDASKIKYRVRNGYITPYVEIRVPKEALKKIVVGPTNNKMLTVQSIYHFLQINGYDINKIDVVSSKIPYRG